MKKKVLLIDHLGDTLVEALAAVCRCSTEYVSSLNEARDKISQVNFDFLILDPWIFDKEDLRSWLEDLKSKVSPTPPRVIILSSHKQEDTDKSYPIKLGIHYDYFIYSDIWPPLKAIINN
ncbi:MAG: hypothetical protein NTX66_04390 [Candidatus Falkowbacteria bacterium]|nr:hypothetical protein [Candidatus Falkowbacteria bacterium]